MFCPITFLYLQKYKLANGWRFLWLLYEATDDEESFHPRTEARKKKMTEAMPMKNIMNEAMPMVKFSPWVFRVFVMAINNKSEND